MIRVNVITEGQTEETFVGDILAPEFGAKNIFLTARCVETSRTKSKTYKLVSFLENLFFEDINTETECENKFIPYLQLHEFEGLLFSDIEKIHEVMKVNTDKRSELVKISEKFNNPELINQGSDTAPSKRLIKLYSTYDKVTSGSIIAQKIGLNEIRKKCSHFNSWLKKIENL